VFQKILTDVASAFAAAEIPYIVIGGQALLLYGELRMTKDIDITLGVDFDDVERVAHSLPTDIFEILGSDYKKFARETRVLPVKDRQTGIRIDLIFSFSPFEQLAIQRANRINIGSAQVSYASLEDMLVFKMVAGRPRDIEDVRSMLRKNPVFDVQYVQHWLAEFENVLERKLVKEFLHLSDEIS
jgi:predicted nucleotidyltransferase